MSVTLFSITHLQRGHVGVALVAPEARYASVRYVAATRLDRRFATADQWKRIEAVLALGPGTDALPRDAAVCDVLFPPDRRSDVVARYVRQTDVEVQPPTAAQTLDAELLSA